MNPDNQQLVDEIKKLQDRLDKLEGRRLLKSDFLPQVVTNRAMGEANSYVKILASSPTGAKFNENTMAYFNSTDSKWYVYNGTTWVKTSALS
ncbi:MAG: hypothetical protein LAN71_17715 [Acidobacteriia bacterium]|nr:hypothetical protein [Terriglobia bacterium]